MLRPVRRPLAALLAVAAAALRVRRRAVGHRAACTRRSRPSGRRRRPRTTSGCATTLLAPKLVDEVERAGLPCEVALEQGLGEVAAPKLTIGKIDVNGDDATAEVRSTAAGEQPSRDTLKLVRVDDAWRIASLK